MGSVKLAKKTLRHITLDTGKTFMGKTFDFSKQRVVIIGDVHGCFDEARQLIKEFSRADDVVIFVGDLVRKGPKSRKVVEYVMKNDFLSVLGNHDLYLLDDVRKRINFRKDNSIWSRLYRICTGSKVYKMPESVCDYDKPLFTKEGKYLDGFKPQHLNLIKELPHSIKIPYHNCLIVHAGIVPGIPLENQEEEDLISIRNIIEQKPGNSEKSEPISDEISKNQENAIVPKSVKSEEHDSNILKQTKLKATSKDTEGKPWVDYWKGPEHIYFGHDAKRLLQKSEFSTGLDTGCVYGKHLTAVILNPDKTKNIVQVKANKTYVIP